MGQSPIDIDTRIKGCWGKPEALVKAVTRLRKGDTTETVIIMNAANHDNAVAVAYFVADAALPHHYCWICECDR